MASHMIDKLQNQLKKLQAENAQIKEENIHLKSLLGISAPTTITNKDNFKAEQTIVSKENECEFYIQSQDKQKIIKQRLDLFRNLFRGREDVYSVRWESQQGKSGYSPACAHEWVKPICKKPLIKCSECTHRKYLPVTDKVIFDHLAGEYTIGVYPLLQDEACWFLTADFDKTYWQEDCLAFMETCHEVSVPASLERSRSGNGGHVWIFFEQAIPALLARKLGAYLLTRAMNKRHQIGLDSYDRLFPNQDTLPKGGFGNLIALPLQRVPRNQGNSVFIDHNLNPYEDQWLFLSQIKKLHEEEIKHLVNSSLKTYHATGFNNESSKHTDEEPWDLFSHKQETENINSNKFLKTEVKIISNSQLYIEKANLSSKIINQIIRLAAFPNPEFYKNQAMRLPTYNIPRFISCSEEFPNHLALPRGCFEELLAVFKQNNIKSHIVDEQTSGHLIDTNFIGHLTPLQDDAQEKLLPHDHGILSATTAFGKTVVAASLIAQRKVNTLIIVHRTQLVEQWKERLSAFLDISISSIGQIGGSKNKRTGMVDIATIQSLNQKGIVKELVAEYGQIIVDECHHISAFSFEQVLKHVKAKYVLGLTATPTRKDGHHPIMTMQCGPIRYKVDAKSQAKIRPFDHIVVPRKTYFNVQNRDESSIQEIYTALIEDEGRNKVILDDILKSLEEGRSPILLTERTSHVEYFEKKLKGFAKNIIVLRGGMGKKQRQEISEKIASIPDTEERILIATGKYIGEGFDDSRLDTLFLVMPISWKGTLQQYAGRLHRLHSNKNSVKIFDYIDTDIPMLQRMYEKRVKGYKAMGYTFQE
jgi:superfamily II DNA or RNA helicase